MIGILAIDQGTSSTKAFVLREDGTFLAVGKITHQQRFARGGIVEQDAEELAHAVESLAERALTEHSEIRGIALANQGETIVAWDRRSKKALGPAITWQDQRTQGELDAFSPETRARVSAIAGLPLDAYFSAAKLGWVLRNNPEAIAAARAGNLGLATSDAFFIDRLTGQYATDCVTASRTSLLNLSSGEWSAELCAIFGVPIELLPPIRISVSRFGEFAHGTRSVPLVASIVDQQAALFGHGCHQAGDTKITFGTGTFALAITGEKPLKNDRGAVPTIAWALPGAACVHALEAGDYTGTAALDWAVRIGIAKRAADFAGSATASAIDNGLIFVPALAGLAAPHWDRGAAGLWCGLRQGTTAEEMRRAILEGVALRAAELIDCVCESSASPLAVDGGLSENTALVRFFADIIGRPVRRHCHADVTAIGIAELGFHGLGLVPPQQNRSKRELVAPVEAGERGRNRRARFREAVLASRALGRS